MQISLGKLDLKLINTKRTKHQVRPLYFLWENKKTPPKESTSFEVVHAPNKNLQRFTSLTNVPQQSRVQSFQMD